MKLMINSNAHKKASLGSLRYFKGIINNLNYQYPIQYSKEYRFGCLNRVIELFQQGNINAIYWSPCHRGPIFAKNHVITVLDCINVEYTYKNDWRRILYKLLFEFILKRAKYVVAISHSTKEAILRNYKIPSNKIVVIPGPSFIQIDFDISNGLNFNKQLVSNKPFILYVTNSTLHKNTINACIGISNSDDFLSNKLKLIVIGSLDNLAYKYLFNSQIDFQVYSNIDDELIYNLYKDCEYLLSSSFDEGLNMPIAEALSLGVNVLCSDIPVHREFYDGLVVFFNPHDTFDITDKLNFVNNKTGDWNLPKVDFRKITFKDVAQSYKNLFENF